MDQKYLTDSESLSLNIEATCLLHSSPRNFPYEIKMDKYRPYPSMISMFTSDSQHPPRSRHAVHLGEQCLENIGWELAKRGIEGNLIQTFIFGLKSFFFTASPHKDFEIAILQDKRHYILK